MKYVVFRLRQIFKMTKKDKENNKLFYKLTKRFFYTYCIIAFVIVATSFFLNIDVVKNGDFQNWTSFVWELGLGAFMASAFLTYENFQNEKAEKRRRKKQEYGLQK